MATIQHQNEEDQNHQQDKHGIQAQEEQLQQLQRDLADAISRMAPLDDIRILLASGAKPDKPVTQGLHPIHYAVYQNFTAAVRLLILRGCDINAMDDNGYTAVHLGAERGYYQLLEFLIQNGAKVCFTDIRNQNYNSALVDEPLSLALKRDHLDCAELLLQNGADPNAKYMLGSEINRINILKVGAIKLLLKYGADPNSRNRSGLSPLMRAARNPLGYATVKVLIDYHADVNDIASEKHDYRTVLHQSIFSGNVDIIKLLLTSGANYPKLDFDKPSPLDIAIISGSPDIVKLLIDFDADVNHGAASIGLPLSIALTQRIKHKFAIVKLLLDAGANPNTVIMSTIRTSGPPLNDYLSSLQQFVGITTRRSQSQNSVIQDQLQILRMLLEYGARVFLVRSSMIYPLGILRTMERLHDELSLPLISLLIDSAEIIDWQAVSKLLLKYLKLSNPKANELNDPSDIENVSPQTLRTYVNRLSYADQILLEEVISRFDSNMTSFNGGVILTLKQLSRIKIRRYMIEKKFVGKELLRLLDQLPVPTSLKNYLAYQKEIDPLIWSHKTLRI